MTVETVLKELAMMIADYVYQAISNASQSNEKEKEEWFTTDQVCKLLHITKGTLYRHRNEGLITPAKYVGRKPLYNQQSINDYLNKFSVE